MDSPLLESLSADIDLFTERPAEASALLMAPFFASVSQAPGASGGLWRATGHSRAPGRAGGHLVPVPWLPAAAEYL